MIRTKFNGRDIWLYMNGMAMFELDEIRITWNDGHVDLVGNASELLLDLNTEKMPILCEIVEILERAALAARRLTGGDEFEVVPAEKLRALAKPLDITNLQQAAMRAIIDGFKTEAGADEPVDVFMQENIKKKTSQDQGPNT